MPKAKSAPSDRRRSLRLWPGVAIVALQWLGRFVVPALFPGALYAGALGGVAGGLLIVVWWAFFSRAPWAERLGGAALFVAALVGTRWLLHESLATGGMGVLYPIYAVPVASLAFVCWAVATRRLPDGLRRATMVATIVAACGVWALVRIGGMTAELDTDFAWRWAKTPEERLLAAGGAVPEAAPATAAGGVAAASVGAEAEWPGFRGPGRDGVVRGVRIATDWSAAPPVELWRRPVGPGWSSFAVAGDVFYTQEQRGEQEVVSCYSARTGEPLWLHGDAARFWEANAGPGPRGTPTLAAGRVYALGATGLLNALDAVTGAVVWSRDAAADTGAALPEWGFAGSPLVAGDLVIAAVSGALAAYDRASGEPRWSRPSEGTSYSSPQRATLGGVEQVLLLSAAGVTSVAVADGALLWRHPWRGYPIIQPARTADGDLLVSVTAESGTRRLAVHRGPEGWVAEERWTSRGLKPYFNDFVVHEGHAYGFDGGILAAIELASGERRWKGGRYGHGQLVLLAEQDLLLVLSERGELALVEAVPGGFTELARLAALDGKSWNHPVVVGDRLLVRNGREMVAFRLALAGG